LSTKKENAVHFRRTGLVGLAAALALVPMAVAVGPATAEPPAAPAAEGDFYHVPADLPGSNGAVIKSEPAALLAGSPLAALATPATATRIMYQSADTNGAPIATTGIVLNPTTPWAGPGRRPLVSLAVGTHGAGDGCGPSRLLADAVTVDGSGVPMFELQIADIAALAARGIAVVVTDYQGLGTEAVHTYLQPVPEAHAVLDAARAAIRLGVVEPTAPVGVWGVSQGGQAAGGTAQLATSYAPDVNLVGTVVGAPAVSATATLHNADGKLLNGTIGFFLNGLMASHPELTEAITTTLNPAGMEFLRGTAQQCDFGIMLTRSFAPTSDYTRNGQSITDNLMADPAIRPVLDNLDLRTGPTPDKPVLIMQNINDEAVDPTMTRQLADTWCSHDATIAYDNSMDTPPLLPQIGFLAHAATLRGFGQATQWLVDRFAGQSLPRGCTN
jgi:hypothetical protein